MDSLDEVQEIKFEKDEDPMIHFGYGIHSYFHMLLRLMGFFLLISLVHIPLFVYYSNWNGLTDIKSGNDSIYTLGNMG